MLSTTDKGNVGVYSVTVDLLERGYVVLFPSGGNPHYDLVIEKENKFYKIQVRYVAEKKNKVNVKLYTQGNNGTNYHKPEHVDMIAAYNSDKKETYYLHRKYFVNSNSIILRFDKPLNNQKQNVRYAKDYRNFAL